MGQEGLKPVDDCKASHEGAGPLKASLFQVFGGLGLFLFGLRLVSDCLQKVVGYRMKRVMATLTRRPLYGLLLGTIVTGIIQSSSATTVMVVGLVNAGLMNLVQSIGVILGANIGSTILPQIVALNPEQWALPAIGVGMVLHLFFKNAKVKDNGLVLLGFGMLFLGLGLMKEAIPAGIQELIQDFFVLSSGSLKGILIGLTVGTVATAVVQASGVTVGIIVVLASQGIVTDLNQSIPLILGCNIGTCVTALIASIGTNSESKRAAVSHVFFNIFGAFLTLVVFYQLYLWLIPKIGGSLAHQIANLHVTVKLVDALLFLPIVGHFSRFISFIVPAKVVEKPSIETPQYLDDKFVEEPVVAIELAIKEIVRLGEISRNMIKYAMDGFMYNDEALLNRVEAYRKAVRTLGEAISRYVIQFSRQDLTEEEAERVPKLILSVNNFDRVARHAVRLLELGRTKVSKNIPLVGSALQELKNTYREVDAMLTEVSGYLPEFKR
jgi:phosphate:Na+ symporter